MLCKDQFLYCTFKICIIIKDPVYLTSKFRIYYQIWVITKVMFLEKNSWRWEAALGSWWWAGSLVSAKPLGRTRKGVL